jgi:hypothetical protein
MGATVAIAAEAAGTEILRIRDVGYLSSISSVALALVYLVSKLLGPFERSVAVYDLLDGSAPSANLFPTLRTALFSKSKQCGARGDKSP